MASYTSVRNGTPNMVTLPAPYGGILVPGAGIIIPDTFANVVAAFGSPIGSGLEFKDLGSSFTGSVGGSAFLTPPDRMKIGPWTRENIAASLTNSAIKCATDGAATFNTMLVEKAGSIVGLWVLLSGAAAGAALTARVTVNGTANATTSNDLVIAIAGTSGYMVYLRNSITFAAGDQLGIAITTPGGWTATTVDLIAGLTIEM